MPLSAGGGWKGYTEIAAPGLKKLMETENPLVVFPLSLIEYNDLHIPGSVQIPLETLEKGLPADRERPLVFYCLGTTCTASWRAAEKAVKAGYKKVYAFREGLPGWVAAGYPTETAEKLPEVALKKISTENLRDILLRGEEMVLLDVRLRRDAEKFWIENANRLYIPLDELPQRYEEIPRDRRVAVICLKGKRSPTVIRYLSGKGYTDLVQVEGGMERWLLEGQPVSSRM